MSKRVTISGLQISIEARDKHIQYLLDKNRNLEYEVAVLRRSTPEGQRASLVMGAMSLNRTARELVDAALIIAKIGRLQ